MDELTRLAGLQLKRQEKLSAVVKEATTVLDEFTAGVRPEDVTMVLRVRHTLGEATLRAHPRDVAGDVMLARYQEGNAAPSVVGGLAAENHSIHLASIINFGLGERRRQGADVARDEILERDLVSDPELESSLLSNQISRDTRC